MKSKYYENKKQLVFKIEEEIDEFSVKKIRREADYEIQRFMPKKVIFDFNGVSFMDSAGIGMIIGRYKEVSICGGQMELANLSDSVRKIFKMSGILKLISETNMADVFTEDEEVANI